MEVCLRAAVADILSEWGRNSQRRRSFAKQTHTHTRERNLATEAYSFEIPIRLLR